MRTTQIHVPNWHRLTKTVLGNICLAPEQQFKSVGLVKRAVNLVQKCQPGCLKFLNQSIQNEGNDSLYKLSK